MKASLSRLVSPVAILLLAAQTAYPQYALFDQSTDTIAINGSITGLTGGTVLGTTATFEAIVSLSGIGGGTIYFEQVNATEHKTLSIADTGVGALAYTPVVNTSGFSAAASISLNVFHHIAFVRDGTDERLYLDGSLLSSRTVAGDIGDDFGGSHPAAIGASVYDLDTFTNTSFLGMLDTFRISNVARYAGPTYTVPTGDLTSDMNTLLLYNFNPGEVSGGLISDLSGNGHTGTFGTGFSGATAPAIVPEPSSAALLTGMFISGGAFLLRRRMIRPPLSTP